MTASGMFLCVISMQVCALQGSDDPQASADCNALDLSCGVSDILRSIAGLSADQEAASLQALQAPSQQGSDKAGLCQWQKRAEGDGLELVHQHSVSHVTWHARGDYFASVAPAGNTQASLSPYPQVWCMHPLLFKSAETIRRLRCADHVLSLQDPVLLHYTV